MLDVVILAAGQGTRMKSNLPKVLHPIGGKAMISHVVDTAKRLSDIGPSRTHQGNQNAIHIITGHGAQQIQAALSHIHPAPSFVLQKQQLGTGHAVQQVLPWLSPDSLTLILYGDVPLIDVSTLERLIARVQQNSLALLTLTMDNPEGYGRIVRDSAHKIIAIVEQKDANAEQRAIREVNTGIMAVRSAHLQQWLPALQNNNTQQEYYLTDIIAMAVAAGVEVLSEEPQYAWEVMGVNDRQQQAQLERHYQYHQAQIHLRNGVTLRDPHRFDCRGQLTCGQDVVIDINAVFEGENVLGDGVVIGPNCFIKNTRIGNGVEIQANCIIEEATIDSQCSIGPFARLRPGTRLASKAKIGNFVETKQATIGTGSKVNHLSYIGDAILGAEVNVGAGTITCNYDGVNKHQTIIEDKVFVGSNTALIAPLTLGEGATIGAGSTIHKNVDKRTLSLTRAVQKSIQNWRRPTK